MSRTSEKSTIKKASKGHTMAYYLVIFLDILGQKEKMRSLKGLPTNEEERQQANQVLKETLGVTKGTRKPFTSYVKAAKKSLAIKQLPLDQIQLFQEMKQSDFSYRYFSDSIIISVKLNKIDEFCKSMNGFYSVL